MPTKEADALNDELIRLTESALRSDVIDVAEATPLRQDTGFGLRFRTQRDKETGEPIRMRFFRVRQSWKGLALSLAAMAWSILRQTLPVFPALGIIKTIWDNLVTLDHEKDATAIHTYEALLKAKKKLGKSKDWPTTAMVSGELTAEVSAVDGLVALLQHGVIDIDRWAAAADAYNEPGNRWKITW